MKSLTTPNRLPLIAVLLPLALTGCKAPYYQSENLTARAWVFKDSNKKPTGKTVASGISNPGDYPAPSAFPESNLDQIKNKRDLGLAFSGGGNMAAVCTLGQVRALREIGVLKHVRYISAVSGGSWFCVPFTFYRGDLHTFLGKSLPPDELTWDKIDCEPPEGSFAKRASHADMKALETLFSYYGNKKYAHRLREIYISPFESLGDEHKFFCQNNKQLESILKRNPPSPGNQALGKEDFIVAASDRPFLIANAVIARKSWFQSPSDRWVPFEMTPMYSGSPTYSEPSGWFNDAAIGGGYVESFAYGSIQKPGWAREIQMSDVTASNGHGKGKSTEFNVPVELPKPFHYPESPRFSIADMMAASGAAPIVAWPDLGRFFMFPKFNHWSPHDLPESKSVEFVHTDGGAIDNTGVIALLRRGVGTIIAFVNSDTTTTLSGKPDFPDSIKALFCNSFRSGIFQRVRSEKTRVFPEEKLAPLQKEFEEQWENGGPLIFDHTYETMENKPYGIKPGQHVRVIWVSLGPHASISGSQKQSDIPPAASGSCAEWVRKLPPETYERIAHDRRVSEEFKHFPNLKVFFNNNWKSVVELTNRQVNALSQFTSYGVIENRELFLKALSGK